MFKVFAWEDDRYWRHWLTVDYRLSFCQSCQNQRTEKAEPQFDLSPFLSDPATGKTKTANNSTRESRVPCVQRFLLRPAWKNHRSQDQTQPTFEMTPGFKPFIVLPLFDYYSPVWDSCGVRTKAYLDKLNRRAACIIECRSITAEELKMTWLAQPTSTQKLSQMRLGP